MGAPLAVLGEIITRSLIIPQLLKLSTLCLRYTDDERPGKEGI